MDERERLVFGFERLCEERKAALMEVLDAFLSAEVLLTINAPKVPGLQFRQWNLPRQLQFYISLL